MNYKSVLEEQIQILQNEQKGLINNGCVKEVSDISEQIKRVVETIKGLPTHNINIDPIKVDLKLFSTKQLVEELRLRGVFNNEGCPIVNS